MNMVLTPISSKEIWENFLLSYAPQSLFQSWSWGEVQIKSSCDVQRIGIFDSGELVGIAQVIVVRARRGTFLHIRHGPVWKSQKYWSKFVQLIAPLAKKEGAWFIRISPLIACTETNLILLKSHGFVPAPIHEVDAERCWILDLEKSEEELLMDMRKTTRYEIRLAQKLGVVVRKSTDVADMKLFFSMYLETSKRHGFVTHTSIAEEFEVFAKNNQAVLFLGFFTNKLIAASIVLFYGGQAIYHHGASISNKVPVSYLVQWEAILEAKKRGIKLYNFYGIAPDDKPNHPWRGITLFKKGFGGREVSYIHAHDLAISPLYIIPKTIEMIRTLRRGY